MTRYLEMMERADRAMHDVAQLHLTEFLGDRHARDPLEKWSAVSRSGGRSSGRYPQGQSLETGEEHGLNGVSRVNAD